MHDNTIDGNELRYNESHFVGWKVLVEITVVTAAVVGISAYSVIVAQRATNQVQYDESDL